MFPRLTSASEELFKYAAAAGGTEANRALSSAKASQNALCVMKLSFLFHFIHQRNYINNVIHVTRDPDQSKLKLIIRYVYSY